MKNFEKIKSLIYQFIISTPQFRLSCVGPWRWHEEMNRSKKDLNVWLDTLDIRSIPIITPELFEKGCKLPKKLVEGNYTIDYNQFGLLDILYEQK